MPVSYCTTLTIAAGVAETAYDPLPSGDPPSDATIRDSVGIRDTVEGWLRGEGVGV